MESHSLSPSIQFFVLSPSSLLAPGSSAELSLWCLPWLTFCPFSFGQLKSDFPCRCVDANRYRIGMGWSWRVPFISRMRVSLESSSSSPSVAFRIAKEFFCLYSRSTYSLHLMNMNDSFAIGWFIYSPTSYLAYLRVIQCPLQRFLWKTHKKMSKQEQSANFVELFKRSSDWLIQCCLCSAGYGIKFAEFY